MIELFKILEGMTPDYLFELFVKADNPYDTRDKCKLIQPLKRTTTYGQCYFQYYGAHVWNMLPINIKAAQSLYEFKSFIRSWPGPTCSCHICTALLLLGTTKNFRPNARDPPRTRLNNTTSQFSLPSTGDPCIIHKNKNGPVESECKLNNVNPHIIRNQYQIQNQIEVTLNEHRYCKLCHYQTNTEF